MKVTVNMACGLANRMFQYSYYLYLKSLGYDAKVDFYTSAKLAHETVAWNRIFPKAPFEEASRLAVMIDGGGSSFQARFRRRFLPFTCNVEQMPTSFDAPKPSEAKRKYIIGVFQNAEMDYYSTAVDYMKSHLEHPKFYVFADNPVWVRENFKDFEYTFVEGNPTSGRGSHFDMQLMSSCRHNIISNSTYSWWGAFLNRNTSKIVIGPKYWYNPKGHYKEVSSERDLY